MTDFLGLTLVSITIGIALMIAYFVVARVRASIPTEDLDANTTAALDETQSTVFSGFTLIAVGIIVLAAFGIIGVFS